MSFLRCQNCDETSSNRFVMGARYFPQNCKRKKDGKISICARCNYCFRKNEDILKDVLTPSHKSHEKKLLLGGPGTGKTFLFKNIIDKIPKNKNVLIITFINNLVDVLNQKFKDANNRPEVKTLHEFCGGLLKYDWFPNLPKIIENDASVLGFNFKESDFSNGFSNLISEKQEEIKFYLNRSDYYNAISYDDSVYRICIDFKNISKKLFDKYCLFVIDEYQDFNFLESSLIELIAQKGNIIIAGDDDQSLYKFKGAKPQFIRKLYYDKSIGFKPIFLSFSRRCTSVLVSATNGFISKITKGPSPLLGPRIKKPFECYWPTKWLDSKKYNKILVRKFFTDSVASRYIINEILSIIKIDGIKPRKDEEPDFLIIGPSQRKYYLKIAYEALKKDERLKNEVFEIEFGEKEYKG